MQPVQGVLALGEPSRRKNCRALDDLLATGLHRVREARWHMKGELLHASGAVPRHDEIVAPLHYTGSELVLELSGIDQQERGAKLLCLPREQGQRRLETAVAHACRCRQPDKFEDVFASVVDYPSPCVTRDLSAHAGVLIVVVGRENLHTSALLRKSPFT